MKKKKNSDFRRLKNNHQAHTANEVINAETCPQQCRQWKKKKKNTACCHTTQLYFPLFFQHVYMVRFFSLKKFYWSTLDVQWCVCFKCPAKPISYTYTYVYSFLDFSHVGRYRVSSRVPYAVQQVVISYPFYLEQCVYMSTPASQFIPPTISSKKCLYKERYIFVKESKQSVQEI